MKYRCLTDLEQIKEYVDNDRPIAFDFETSPNELYRREDKAALDAHKAHIVGISFSVDEGDAIYVPLAHDSGTNAEQQDELWTFFRLSVFENRNRVKIAHNLAFEAMFLYAKGIIVQQPCYDTIAAAQLTLKAPFEYRTLHDSGLKLLAIQLYGADMPSFEKVTKGRHFDEMYPQEYETVRYACADSDYTLRLYYRFNAWFNSYLPQHRVIVEQLESPTSVYCGMMKYNGVPMDRVLMQRKNEEATAKIESIKAEIDRITGGVNIGANASTAAFKKYLYETLGLPVLKTTEKNKEAADDAAMQMLKEWCEEHKPDYVRLFELVQEYRKWGKLKSTYIDGYFSHINDETYRIHPDFMPLGTETGRFAARNPNLQNCPRKTNDPIGVRNFICCVSVRSTAETGRCLKPTEQEAIYTHRQHRSFSMFRLR